MLELKPQDCPSNQGNETEKVTSRLVSFPRKKFARAKFETRTKVVNNLKELPIGGDSGLEVSTTMKTFETRSERGFIRQLELFSVFKDAAARTLSRAKHRISRKKDDRY